MSADQSDRKNKAALTIKDDGRPLEAPGEDLKAARTIRDMDPASDRTVMEGGAAGRAGGQAASLALVPEKFRAWPVKRLISQSGGEADIFIIDYKDQEAILRIYRHGQKPKPEISSKLREISRNMGGLAVEVFETGHDEETGRWYEVQEYIRQGSLARLLEERGLSEAEFKALAGQMTEALSRLHRADLIHRDLKPDNILLKSREPLSIVLADFGIASRLGADVSIKATRRANTPIYAAPEAFADLAGVAGDWWSLGAILLEIKLGRHPLAGLSPNKVMGELVSRGLAVPEGLPPDTALLLKGLLTRDYEKRWRGEEVRRWLAGERNIAVFYETPAALEPTRPARASGQSFKFNEQEYHTLADLAAAFAREENWAKAEVALARGFIGKWLENNSRFDEALELEQALTGQPHENLFHFILKFNPARGPVYRGLPLGFNDLVDYAANPGQSPARQALLKELAEGKLGRLPELAERAGRPLDELTAAILKSTRWDNLELLRGALAALEKPWEYIWGPPGPPAERPARLNFALEAGTPLVSVKFWQKNLPAEAVLPKDIISGLANPAAYIHAKENLERLIAEELLENAAEAGCRATVELPDLAWPVNLSEFDFTDYLKAKEQRLERERKELIAKYRKRIVLGSYHTLGLKSDGTVLAAGKNDDGQCDTGSWRDIVAVAAGSKHTVGLKSDGTVVATGKNECNQCRTGSWRDIVEIAAGAYHTVGLKSDGTVVKAGERWYGENDTRSWYDIVEIAAGYRHTLGLRSDGTMVATTVRWIFNYGHCDTESWRGIVAIAAGLHTVGLKSDGTVVAGGNNDRGQCNTGSWRDIVAIAAGPLHTVGLKSDGTVVAVGDNDDNQCDTGSWRDIIAIAAGPLHTVGLKSDGTVVAVGGNDDGQCDVGSWRDIL